MRMNGLPLGRAARVQCAMAGTQPAERHRPVLVERIEREADVSAGRVPLLHSHEHVSIARAASLEPQPELHVPGELGVLGEAIVEHRPSFPRVVADLCLAVAGTVRQRRRARIEPQLPILGTRDRPFRLGALHRDTGALTHLQSHARPGCDLCRALP